MSFAPIAITGMWSKFPGCETPEALWQAVLAGRDLVAEGRTRIACDEDPVFAWALEGARGALANTGRPAGRGGLVLGNMFLPTRELVRWAGHVWFGNPPVDPRSRFSTGAPALLVARELGLEVGAFALDAACATSLFALKLACDKLHDGEADWMLAGAVSHADATILDQALGAQGVLSPSGRSRPFHDEADGMVWSEGAAFVVLRPLEAAVAAGDRILGVIRGIAVNNSGKARGLLAPSERAQIEVMQAAYREAGLEPAEVPLVECHATGSPLGDLIELRALKRVFGPGLKIGSIRSNLGHPIAASGFASLFKVLFALQDGVLPPSLHGEAPVREVSRGGFQLVTAPQAWEGPRRAGINAFGFGGNNAHLIVEAWSGQAPVAASRPEAAIAVVGIAVRAGAGPDTAAFAEAVRTGRSLATGRPSTPAESELLPQQALLLEVADEALTGLAPAPRTGILIGLQCDPTGAESAFGPVPGPEAFLGRLTNLAANRLNFRFDGRAPGFTVAAEEGSGLVALRLAMRSLRAGEADMQLVGAVDLAAEPVHEAAARQWLGRGGAGDAAVALVLKRLADAREAGDPVLAILDDRPGEPWTPTAAAGRPHAAEGLLQVAAALLARPEGPTRVIQLDLGGFRHGVTLTPPEDNSMTSARRKWAESHGPAALG